MFCNLIPTKAEMAKRIMKNAAPEYPIVLYVLFFDFFFAKIIVDFYKTPFVEGKISKSLISRFVAILMALAKALKMASIL